MPSKFSSLSASIAFGLSLAFSAQAQDVEKQPSWEMQKEAEFIARATGETVENTLRQLQLENDIAEQQISLKLREEFRDRLTGISISHEQGTRLVVLLKGDGKVPERVLQINGNTLIVDFRAGYSHTKTELQDALRNKRKDLAAEFPELAASSIQERKGEIVLYVLKNDSNNIEHMTMRAKEILGVPVRIEELASRLIPQSVKGGGTLNIGCTTGFTVKQKYGTTRGVLSAAHCTGYLVTYSDGNGPGAFLLS